MSDTAADGIPVKVWWEDDDYDPDDEWMKQRSGKLTCSQFPVLMKIPRSKNTTFTDAALTYLRSRVAERLGSYASGGGGSATQWGHEHEPTAIKAYEEVTGFDVDYNSRRFLQLNDIIGGSPDGLVGTMGVVEVKCPYNPAVHIRTLMERKVPDAYFWQCVGHCLVSQRAVCDFVSFDPRIDGPERIIVIPVVPTPEQQLALMTQLNAAAKWIDEALKQIKGETE